MHTPDYLLAVTNGDLTQWHDFALERGILMDSDLIRAGRSPRASHESLLVNWFVIGDEHFGMQVLPVSPEQEGLDNANQDPVLLITPLKKNRSHDLEAARALVRALVVADAACQCRCFESEMESGKRRWRPFV